MTLAPTAAGITLVIPCALLTVNRERKQGHWSARATTTAETRLLAKAAARTQPPFDHVRILVRPVQPKGRLADTGAHAPSAKAAIDGLVDAGLIVDDDGRYIRSLTYLAPVKTWPGLTEGLVLTIEEDFQ